MKILKIKNKIKILSIALVLLSFCFASTASAQDANPLQINFQNGNGIALFDEANFLPGDAVTRYVDVENQSDDTQAVVVKTESVSDVFGLADWMTISIDRMDGPGSLLYQSSLADFFALSTLHLDDLEPGLFHRYFFSVTLSLDAPEELQDGNLFFDIVVGEGALESFAVESDSSSGSQGSSFVYNNLELTNVAIVTGVDTATITWDTNKNATSRVVYDTASHPDLSGTMSPNYSYAYSTALQDSPADANGVINHAVIISGLAPSTTYYFRPISSASPEKTGAELSFTTGQLESDEPLLAIEKIEKIALFGVPDDRESVYKITVQNDGQETAVDVKIEDELPDGMVFASDEKVKKTWQLGDIEPGEYKEVSYAVKQSATETRESKGEIKVLSYNHEPIIKDSKPVALESSIATGMGSFGNYFVVFAILVFIAVLLGLSGFLYSKI